MCSPASPRTWAREVKPSLLRMFSTCPSAVRCATTSRAAISRLLRPSRDQRDDLAFPPGQAHRPVGVRGGPGSAAAVRGAGARRARAVPAPARRPRPCSAPTRAGTPRRTPRSPSRPRTVAIASSWKSCRPRNDDQRGVHRPPHALGRARAAAAARWSRRSAPAIQPSASSDSPTAELLVLDQLADLQALLRRLGRARRGRRPASAARSAPTARTSATTPRRCAARQVAAVHQRPRSRRPGRRRPGRGPAPAPHSVHISPLSDAERRGTAASASLEQRQRPGVVAAEHRDVALDQRRGTPAPTDGGRDSASARASASSASAPRPVALHAGDPAPPPAAP